uniref:hypothetical protein n=1 Tax=Acetatifactor sp. TaxID=1872090 RepID=UPI00405600C9
MMKDLWDMGKDLLEEKARPSMSIIIYLVCGLIEILCIVSLISPFHFSMGFLDDVNRTGNIADNSLIVRVAFWSLVVYLLVCVVRKTIVRLFQEKNETLLRNVYAIVYTIDDLIDLIVAGASLVFMIAVFIQVYKDGTILLSFCTVCIYVAISIRFFSFLGCRFFVNNLKIIDGALKRNGDMDSAK